MRSSFPTAFLTFSLLLLVLAGGFALGRLVVGRANLKQAGQFDKLPTPRPEVGAGSPAETAPPSGEVYVPEPSGAAGKESRPQEQAAPPPAEQPGAATPEAGSPPPPPEQPEVMPAPAEGPSASEEKQKRFAIQVGVFVAESGAQQLADELARAGYPARVELGQENGATVYRVVTGRYRTEYAARKAMDELRQEGFPGFLVER